MGGDRANEDKMTHVLDARKGGVMCQAVIISIFVGT
jgi:hypothetical protein